MRFYTPQVDGDLESKAHVLDASPDYRVLRRLPKVEELWVAPTPAGGPATRLAVIDSETEGLAVETDKLIEIAVVRLAIDEAGQLCEIEQPIEQLEDPGRPLTEEVVRITGLSNELLRGRRFDERLLAAALGDVDVIVAHNARFDAPFWRRRFAGLNHPWACSLADLDWASFGVSERNLTGLLAAHGFFYEAHRAAADAWALAMLLATHAPDGRTMAAHLVESARAETFRVHAMRAPFEQRGALKCRGYRWNAVRRVWTKDVQADELTSEQAWLVELSRCIRPLAVSIDWYSRHTD